MFFHGAAPHAFRISFRRTARSGLRPIRHRGGEAPSTPEFLCCSVYLECTVLHAWCVVLVDLAPHLTSLPPWSLRDKTIPTWYILVRVLPSIYRAPGTNHRFPTVHDRSRSFRADGILTCKICMICMIVARATEWWGRILNLHDLGHVPWAASVPYRSCTASHIGRLRPI